VTLVAQNPLDVDGYALSRRLLSDQQVTVLLQRHIAEICGERYVDAVVVEGPDGVRQRVPAEGVFIENGLVAQTGFLGDLAERTPSGHIVVDERRATRCDGLFAAGDITSASGAEQILIALGDGTRAAISACNYLLEGGVKVNMCCGPK
jgi:alkyl hydroperoxide reductase subunit F